MVPKRVEPKVPKPDTRLDRPLCGPHLAIPFLCVIQVCGSVKRKLGMFFKGHVNGSILPYVLYFRRN